MSSDHANLCTDLQELQVRRNHYIRTANKLSNAIGALVRRGLGWHKDAPDAEAIRKRAASLVSSFMKSGEVSDEDRHIGNVLRGDLTATSEMLSIAEKARHEIELDMKRIARKLPACVFVKSVGGFGELGFAVLIGETGDLSNYSTPDKVRKRLGLAPYNGRAGSNWRKKGGLTAEQWIDFGYRAQRRAQVFAVIEDPLFRHQAKQKGPYHAIYLARREHTAQTHPDWTKGHSHGDAKRIMVQRLADDLWKEWRQARDDLSDKAKVSLPASTPTPFRVGDALAKKDLPPGQNPAAEASSPAEVV